MEERLTSFELSKKLWEADFRKGSRYVWCKDKNGYFVGELQRDDCLPARNGYEPFFICYAYDLLWDACVKYADEFWDVKAMYYGESPISHFNLHLIRIVELMQQNKKAEAEDYIWKHCKFNAK
jgi:hypothetical protein